MKYLLLFFLIVPAAAQTTLDPDFLEKWSVRPAVPCDLDIKDSPTVRGLKLGMTREETLKIIKPSTGVALNKYINFFQRAELAKLQGFIDVDKLAIFFDEPTVDSKLLVVSHLQFYYSDKLIWNNTGEFFDNIVSNLSLPKASFVTPENSFIGSVLKCKGFLVTVQRNDLALQSTSHFDDTYRRIIEKKKNFKP